MEEEVKQNELTTRDKINSYLHLNEVKIDDAKYTEFWNFVILWNLFESRLFERDFSVTEAKDKMTFNVSEDKINAAFDYIKKRYFNENLTPNELFDKLGFRNKQRNENRKKKVAKELIETHDEKKVKAIIANANCELADKALAVTIIIYRYRNNFFHGEKNIVSLTRQEGNFKFANDFLIACLEANK